MFAGKSETALCNVFAFVIFFVTGGYGQTSLCPGQVVPGCCSFVGSCFGYNSPTHNGLLAIWLYLLWIEYSRRERFGLLQQATMMMSNTVQVVFGDKECVSRMLIK
jgi:hypothetical protein